MKLVLDDSVATKWYLPVPDSTKAMRLRFDFHTGGHELLAPDTLPVDCADVFVAAERKGAVGPGETARNLTDLLAVGIAIHPAFPLLRRAAEIALLARLTVYASIYVALAEREQCQYLTADQRVARATRKHFPFVITFAALP